MTLSANDCYRRNLAALRDRQPDVAVVIDGARTPEGVVAATGRDGSKTLLIPRKDGGLVWFGRSSMPRVSSEEMLCGVQRDGGGVLLPGIFTGAEPIVAAARLAPYSAVFVVEPSPFSVKLAMRLHDYAGLFGAGRLVLLVGDDLEGLLRCFFEAHTGYEMPTHLLNLPQLSPARTAELQRRLELAGEGVLAVQAKVVAASAQAIQCRFGATSDSVSLPPKPRVALVSADVGADSFEQAGRIERALAELSWPHESCVPDRPEKCHVSARLRAIERAEVDFVLSVNGLSSSTRALLPARLPVVSWHLTEATTPRVNADQVGEYDIFLAASPGVQSRLANAGVPVGAIQRCEIAADDTTYHPTSHGDAPGGERELDVAVLMDLPTDGPEECGISLPSHVALWRAMREVVTGEIERYSDEAAGRLFDRAQRVSGTTIKEAPIRISFWSFCGRGLRLRR